ncbi:prolipoprotein diacylglyceryl transferase [Gammaproteobacteria bacterium]|nr:prolipoprotein diacylglyceryl transferase [Gammaproteobacteria bacterium]
MILPEIDPVALQIGPIAIRWYGLTWLAAFYAIYFLIRRYQKDLNLDQVSDLMFYSLLGAIIGGRAGYVFFYSIDQFINNPFSIFFIWQGGLSFHGGLVGVLIACFWLSKSWKIDFFWLMDRVALFVPPGLGFVRLGNFMNSELLGRPTDLSWGIIFPSDPLGITRHPSQLYQAFGEGILLFIYMLWIAKKPKPTMNISGHFLLGYGLIRFLTEFFRAPDQHIGFTAFDVLTRGQMLCLPMIVIGIILIYYSYRKQT